ncbi:DUF4158 domain-containing protein [Nonomuraea fuscirosea]|uniref:DUF4158 domain-containing protein n=1 Tax=Nonomuraea fuscirosea TaxID=1291556 RepID=UPI00342529B2
MACYGRFPEEPSAAALERFFRLDRSALDALASKRCPATKLGWAVQWGTVRMLEGLVQMLMHGWTGGGMRGLGAS